MGLPLCLPPAGQSPDVGNDSNNKEELNEAKQLTLLTVNVFIRINFQRTMCISVYANMQYIWAGAHKTLDPLKLELQVVENQTQDP